MGRRPALIANQLTSPRKGGVIHRTSELYDLVASIALIPARMGMRSYGNAWVAAGAAQIELLIQSVSCFFWVSAPTR
jgi:hypothetical protein